MPCCAARPRRRRRGAGHHRGKRELRQGDDQPGTRELEREGTATLLTSGEFGLLRVLLEHPRQPMSRDKLMELARGREYEVFDRAIDVQVSRLRKLVEEDPGKPRYIQTVWGFGYVYVPDGTKHSN
jgi:two-component system phosphate regulon response regulator OmpR